MINMDYEPQTESTPRRIAKTTGLYIWNNKTLDQLTDAEIIQAFQYIAERTGVYYYWGQP